MKLIEVNPINPDPKIIKEAAQIINTGGLVAFPTETVYGLGADALNPTAVARIFQEKNRPLDQPLSIAVSSPAAIKKLVKKIPQTAMKLIDTFLPGPLTLILLKSETVPDIVTSRTPKVAIRIPDHPVAISLIIASGVPITATSANLTGHPNPVNARKVLESSPSFLRAIHEGRGEALPLNASRARFPSRVFSTKGRFDGRRVDSTGIDLILDAGPTKIGVESTIVDLTDKPTILRIGAISKDAIESVIGPVLIPKKIESA
jgi:L-threonylcarbamoyladenylate synthase